MAYTVYMDPSFMVDRFNKDDYMILPQALEVLYIIIIIV